MKKKLTPIIINRINELKKLGLIPKQIAERLGLSIQTVRRAPK